MGDPVTSAAAMSRARPGQSARPMPSKFPGKCRLRSSLHASQNATATTKAGSRRGTAASAMKTEGWGWLFGGGLEAWVKPSFALYAEAGQARLKGTERNSGPGTMDDRTNFVLAGIRIHIGG